MGRETHQSGFQLNSNQMFDLAAPIVKEITSGELVVGWGSSNRSRNEFHQLKGRTNKKPDQSKEGRKVQRKLPF